MGENREVPCEGTQDREDDATGEEAQAVKEETERGQKRDEALFVLFKRSGLCAHTLSELAKEKDSFGSAWLFLRLFSKVKAHGRLSIEAPGAIDLSGFCGLTAKKIFLFLDFLPSSVEEIKLDGAAMKGPALPLFIRFFQRLKAVREKLREDRGPLLKRFHFADNSIGPKESPKIFPLLVPLLEGVSLKGNSLGVDGFRALAGAVREGMCSSLRCLDLQKTGLQREGLEILCACIKEKGLGLETLNLSQNRLGDEEMQILCPFLSAASLPLLKVLLLRECELGMKYEIEQLAEALQKGGHSQLESLDLEGNFMWSLEPVTKILQSLPSLKNLNLMVKPPRGRMRGVGGVWGFLNTLGSQECFSLENVAMRVDAVSNSESTDDETVRTLAAGVYPSVRTLSLTVPPYQFTLFFRELAALVAAPFETIDLFVVSVGGEKDEEVLTVGLLSLREGILKGRLGFLRKFQFGVESMGKEEVDILMDAVVKSDWGLPNLESLDFCWTAAGEGAESLGRALASGKLGGLGQINLFGSGVTDEGVRGIAEAVMAGAMVGMSSLELGNNPDVSGEVWEEFMVAIAESDKGMPKLSNLGLSVTNAKRVGGSLLFALGSGKLPSLERLFAEDELILLDEKGVETLGDVVKRGTLPPRLGAMGFSLKAPNVNCDALIRSIALSEKGLPFCVKTLNVKWGRVGEDALAFLAASGKGSLGGKLPGLERLDLFNWGIDDGKVKRLGEVFAAHGCPRLNILELSKNRITIAGFSAFVDTLCTDSLPNVRHIFLNSQEEAEAEEEPWPGSFAIAIQNVKKRAQDEGKLPGLINTQL
uniref:Uncharacterized protein n=1 Tax=Chromera velia CCMP2878 TaxID=1169474 RepID=A0A0G4I4V8_9ALVE|eukprot:Cvel_1827.t1-p1 / transcript=Cvel_1827.t1 / gene=Cvel_1827 / organism=Chromera_velia_CCMP2878 / gene_product=hypothetical protein / transcript_product=hypothetical protein / location=Cvel_scaffold67:95155-100837(+) / protein_length=818 / sequence_SO=supercontig / SO=protein_coding / is_pseudo=false